MSVVISNSTREFASDSEDLIYKITTTDTVTADFKFVVVVKVDGVQFGKFYLTPNPSNVAFFNLSGACRDLAVTDSSNYPSGNIHEDIIGFSKATTGVKLVELEAGKYVSSTETLDIDSSSVYLIDGYRRYEEGLWGSWDYLKSNSANNQVWLTERVPASKIITIESNETEYGVVGFLNDSTFGSTATHLEYKLYNGSTLVGTQEFPIDPTTNAQLPTTGTTIGKLLYWGVYPLNIVDALSDISATGLDPIQSSNTWTHYTLQLGTNTGVFAGMSNFIKVQYTKYQCKHESVFLGWANRLGAWDYIMFDGRKQESIESTNKSYWTETGTWSAVNYQRPNYASQRKQYGVMVTEKYSLTAYIRSADAYKLIPSLYSSNQVYAYISGQWLPVHVTGSNQTYHSEPLSRMQEIAVEITLSNPVLC